MLATFKDFLAEKASWDMYVTGTAGTGKTTGLNELVSYCIANNISYVVCAYTHKACDVLKTKLPSQANIQTLHKFLNKRPTYNVSATNKKHIQTNMQFGDAEGVGVVFVDEYSMIDEQDLMDVRAMQDAEYAGIPQVKAVWLGDPYQLPPVKGVQAIKPHGPYAIELTKVYRQADDNKLKDTVLALADLLRTGKAPEGGLDPHESFIRGQGIATLYQKDLTTDKILLSYTNYNVEYLNSKIEKADDIYVDAKVYSPTTKEFYYVKEILPSVSVISLPFGDELALNSKFKTLEYLHKMGIRFAVLEDMEGEEWVYAFQFGSYSYKTALQEYETEAAKTNKVIETKHKGFKAASWAKLNSGTTLARTRAKAWRDLICFKDCVICLDFSHAMTVHKSQGSTFKHVYLDTEDLYKAAQLDYNMYVKLMYVAISRASEKVWTN